MFCYSIQIHSLPRIRFACSTTTDKYKNIFDCRKNLIEISTSYGVGVYVEFKNETIFKPSPSLSFFMPDINCKTYAAEPGEIISNSVAMEIDEFDFQRIEFTQSSINELDKLLEDRNHLLVPFFMALDSNQLHITNIIQEIISLSMKNSLSAYYQCISLWFKLLTTIDSAFRNSLLLTYHADKIPPSFYYVKKATKYIREHYCENIRIRDIAKELNITPNYLSYLFKTETGNTIIEFVNRLRAQKIREMAFSGNISSATIAESVGLHNACYMQRMFKKIFGISIQECRRIDHEISLNHPKPWDMSELDRDLMSCETNNTL